MFTFHETYKFHFSNIFAMASTSLTSILMIPVLYSIIWFERDNHNRTLINVLVSSMLWIAIGWNFVVHPWTILRYIFGPFNSPSICTLDYLLRNVPLIQVNILQNTILIVRCLSVFHWKNPTAVQEEFWIIFINCWGLAVAVITELVFILLPGRNPMNYYLCTGHFPLFLQDVPVKKHASHALFGVTSFFIYSITKLMLKYHKLKTSHSDPKNTHNLFSFTTYGALLLLLIIFFYVPVKINQLQPSELDTYPNYILIYVLHLYMPQTIIATVSMTFFWKNASLRKKVSDQIKELLNCA